MLEAFIVPPNPFVDPPPDPDPVVTPPARIIAQPFPPVMFNVPPVDDPPDPPPADDPPLPPPPVIVEKVVSPPAAGVDPLPLYPPPPPPTAVALIRYTPVGTVQFPEPDAIDVIAPTPFSHGADGPRCAMLTGFVSSADIVAARRILFAPRSSLSKST